jgi:hypothetical protein
VSGDGAFKRSATAFLPSSMTSSAFLDSSKSASTLALQLTRASASALAALPTTSVPVPLSKKALFRPLKSATALGNSALIFFNRSLSNIIVINFCARTFRGLPYRFLCKLLLSLIVLTEMICDPKRSRAHILALEHAARDSDGTANDACQRGVCTSNFKYAGIAIANI